MYTPCLRATRPNSTLWRHPDCEQALNWFRFALTLVAACVVGSPSGIAFAYDTLVREFGDEFGLGTSIERMPLPGDGWPWFGEHLDHTIPLRGQFASPPVFYGDSGERVLWTKDGGHSLCWRHTNSGFDDLALWCDTDGDTALIRIGVPLGTVAGRRVWADGTVSGVFVGYGGGRVAVTYRNWQYIRGPDGQSAHSSLQVLLIDRSDRAPGDFEIQWRAAYPVEALDWEGEDAFVNIVVDVNDRANDLNFVQPVPMVEPYIRPGEFPIQLGPHPDVFFSESNENGEPGVWSLQIREGEAVRCGNGVVESTEACDDGNRLAGDACSETCDAVFDVPVEPEPDAGQEGTGNDAGADAGRSDALADVESDDSSRDAATDRGGAGGSSPDARADLETPDNARAGSGSGCAMHSSSADAASRSAGEVDLLVWLLMGVCTKQLRGRRREDMGPRNGRASSATTISCRGCQRTALK